VGQTTRPFFYRLHEECTVLHTIALSLALAWMLGSGVPVAGQGYSHGIFIGTPHGPIELTAYAEVVTNGQLRMAKGSRENIPTLSEIQRVLCNLPNWEPGAIMIANQAIFLDEKAERRDLRFAVRRLNISALELRVEDLERKDRLAQLIQGVGASESSPAFVFVVMAGNGMSRFYPFRVRLE
jgi:hypothetical protein